MTDKMWALIYDRARGPWSRTRGLVSAELPRPELDESRDPADRSRVIVKTRYAGFCGSDRGIWFRRAFGDMIERSLDRDHTDRRIIGHELLGEVVSAGTE